MEEMKKQNESKMEEKDRKMEEMKKQNEEKDSKMEEKDRKIKTLQGLTLKGMLKEFGGIPDMPLVGELKPHEHAGCDAIYEVDHDLITEDDLKFTIKTMRSETDEAGNNRPIEVPHFYNNFRLKKVEDGKRVLEYCNEATVADYVQGVVSIVLQTLGIFGQTKLYKEMTLFSLRPDLLLMEIESFGIVLIIEVKMPGEALFNSRNIAGQVSNYLLLQYRLGNRKPFVLLSSYRTACLCHLAVDPRNEETESTGGEGEGEQEQNEYRKIIRNAAQSLRDDKVRTKGLTISETDEDENDKTQPSPKKDAFPTTDSIPEFIVGSIASSRPSRKRRKTSEPMIRDIKPVVKYSRPFGLKDMLQGVSLAIAASLESKATPTQNEDNTQWPTNGSSINGLHPWVDETKLGWVWVKNIRINYMTHPPLNNPAKFLLLKTSGKGKNGVVSLAIDEDGNACALKFYRPSDDPETIFNAKGRKKAREKDFKDKNEIVKEELSRWQKLQPLYVREGHVEVLKLKDQNVLRMPVCFPVPVNERRNVLDTVKTILLEFLSNGFIYEEVRWRHVGCRHGTNSDELEIIMLDLESMKEKGVEDDQTVDGQISELQQRIGSEPVAAISSRLGL